MVENFAGQWLYLRNLDGFVPNSVGFPNFDDNLRQGLKMETQLFFQAATQLVNVKFNQLKQAIWEGRK